MKLQIKDRFNLLNMLPQQGNIMEQMQVRDITKKLDLTEEEKEKIDFKIKPDNGVLNYTWDSSKEFEKDIKISKNDNVFLKSCVKKLDEQSMITPNNLDTCLMFYKPNV